MRMRSGSRWAAIASVAAALAYAPLGCRGVLGIDDRKLLTCGDAFPAGSCTECVAASCCDEASACGADAACAPGLACFVACAPADSLCQAACDPSGANVRYATLRTCLASHCSAACGPACGGVPLLPTNVCDASCVSTCCGLGEAAAKSDDYGALRACRAGCADDVDCAERCKNEHADGASRARAIDECVDAACGGLSRWACVAPHTSPKATAPTIRLDLTLHDVVSSQPLVGLEVRACAMLDIACTSPATNTATTDVDGKVTLVDVPISPLTQSFDGYVEVQSDKYHALLLAGQAWTADASLAYNVPSDAVLAAGAANVGVTLRADRGFAFFAVSDCNASQPAGVVFEYEPTDAASIPFYVDGIVPDVTLQATLQGGRGGLANALPGYLTARATVPELCGPVAARRVPVRAGWFTGSSLNAALGY